MTERVRPARERRSRCADRSTIGGSDGRVGMRDWRTTIPSRVIPTGEVYGAVSPTAVLLQAVVNPVVGCPIWRRRRRPSRATRISFDELQRSESCSNSPGPWPLRPNRWSKVPSRARILTTRSLPSATAMRSPDSGTTARTVPNPPKASPVIRSALTAVREGNSSPVVGPVSEDNLHPPGKRAKAATTHSTLPWESVIIVLPMPAQQEPQIRNHS